jgi:UDP-glucose 4-epimerase
MGGAGFIGPHLSSELAWRGGVVVVLDDPSTSSLEISSIYP